MNDKRVVSYARHGGQTKNRLDSDATLAPWIASLADGRIFLLLANPHGQQSEKGPPQPHDFCCTPHILGQGCLRRTSIRGLF